VNGRIRFDDQTVLLSQLTNGPVSVQLDDLVAFYNPPQVQFGLRGGSPVFTAAADVVWTGWSGFRELSPPFSAMSIDSLAGVGLDIELGEDLGEPGWRDTWSPRLGVEVHPGALPAGRLFGTLAPKARLGFQLAPTPVPDQTGRTSYMDSDRWTLGAGLGVEAKQITGFTKGPVKFDVGLAYQHVMRRDVTKDASLVGDTNGDGYLDYPVGFPVNGTLTSQGRALAFSANLSFAFDAMRSRDPNAPNAKAAPAPSSPGGQP
jgi:long-subunit fatty acid transport protein